MQHIAPSAIQAQDPNCHEPDPACAAISARMTADLLAESIEIAQVYIPFILRACREADDAAILENCHYFDAAASCARQCAIELRDLVSPFIEEGGR